MTPFLPSPPRFGAQRRLHELIAGVAAANDVSVLSLVDPREDHSEEVRATEEYCRRVVTVANPTYCTNGARKRLRQLASLGSQHSYEWLGHSEEPFRAALQQMLARPFDVVHFELAPMAGYADVCRAAGKPGPVLCLDEHNIEYEITKRTSAGEAGVVRRLYSAFEWRKVRREERLAWSHLDGCTVTSERDQEMLLAEEPGAHTAVVPNGVDLDAFHPSIPANQAESKRPTLLFFGAIDYFPNTDAVLYFLDQIFPTLQLRYPGLRLSIVGRRPPDVVLARCSDAVEVTGMVDDVRPRIAGADAVVVPLRIGGGTRLKILEAMSMGKAVVSTTLGAEGLDVVDDRDLLIGDDPAAFAAQVSRVLDDPGLSGSLGVAAREFVAARFSWKEAVRRLTGFYEELVERRAETA